MIGSSLAPQLGLERERATLSHGDLAYRIDGAPDAPALVLSNSLGTALEMWSPQVPALSGYFRVIRYDQRGHGRSSAPAGPYSIEALASDVVELLDVLSIERASFAGLSLGGMIGMWLGARHAERIDRLVLCCTAPILGPPEMWTSRAEAAVRNGTGSLASELFARWFTPRLHAEDPPVLEAFRVMLDACSDQGYAACCEAVKVMDQRGSLASIAAPTLVLAGAEDPVGTPEVSLGMASAIPGAALTVLPAAAHLANVAQPSEFTEAMLSHLTGPPVERGAARRRAVLGRRHVDAAIDRAAATGSNAGMAFQELLSAFAWGSVWARPAIDTRTRRLLTLALVAGLGRAEEFELHARSALADQSQSGLDAEAIREVLLHTAVYAGVPAANAALAQLERIVSDC